LYRRCGGATRCGWQSVGGREICGIAGGVQRGKEEDGNVELRLKEARGGVAVEVECVRS
jgi:hypothetical protein